MVNIEEDGSWQLQAQSLFGGALYWHHPKRAWDGRLSIAASDFLGGDDYSSEVQTLVGSFAVTSITSSPALTVSVQAPYPEFKINSIVLRRETSHTSRCYPDLSLHLSEIQDLNVQPSTGMHPSYGGSIKTESEMKALGRMWWEVSLSSRSADTILCESEDLELGETATWKPQDVIRNGVVEDMTSVAQEVITRMDHVGLHTKGAKQNPRKKTTPKTSEPPMELYNGLNFW